MNRFYKGALGASLAFGLTASACGSETEPDLVFEKTPKANFAVGDCWSNLEGWVSHIDPDASDVDTASFTIGLSEETLSNGYPVFGAGAIIKGIGGAKYLITTSEGQSGVADLKNGDFATVLPGEEGKYDGVLTGRIEDESGRVNFRLSCLPDFSFYGDSEPTPLSEIPVISAIPATTAATN